VSKGALLLSPRGFATPVSTEKGSSSSVASSGESLAENEVRFALPRVVDQDRRDDRGRSIALVRGEKRARLIGPRAPPTRLGEKRKSLESSLGLAALEERSSEKNAGAIVSSLRVELREDLHGLLGARKKDQKPRLLLSKATLSG